MLRLCDPPIEHFRFFIDVPSASCLKCSHSMSSPTITHDPVPESRMSEIVESLPRPNFAAWFVLAVVVFIWVELSPIWLPPVSRLISFLAPIFWFFCGVVVALAGVLLVGFGLAMVGLLLGGTTPSSR